MKAAYPASIFSSKVESLNLIFPFVFLAAVAFELLFTYQIGAEKFWHKILIDIIFLNVTHNAFTFAMILGVPELKEWISDRTQLQKLYLALESLTVVVLIFFAHVYIFKSFDQARSKALFSFFLFFIPSHHALAQSFGLNYIYNSLAEKKTMLQLEKYERWLSVCFMVLILSYLTIIFFPNEMISFFGSKAALLLRKFTLRGTFLVTLLFVVLFLKYPKEIRLKKIIFSSRYLVWFFALFSHSAAIGTSCIHGIEYACVTHKVMSRSKGRFRWIWLITLSVLVAYICYFREIMMMSLRSFDGASGMVASVASLSIAISYLHYFLDRRLFRMRHPLNRKTMGSLLID